MTAMFKQLETRIDSGLGRRNLGMVLLGLIMIFFLIYPNFEGTTNYGRSVFISGFFWAILASSWALLAGISGQFSFGHMAFMGIGAYTAGLVARYGLHFIIDIEARSISSVAAIIIGTLVSGVVGLIIGWLLLRLRSSYLALFTIAFSELFRLIMQTEFNTTGGANGLSLRPLVNNPDVVAARTTGYYIMLALLVVSLVGMYVVANSRIGLFLRAMREDEDAASALGVNVVLYKVLIFVLTSMTVGLAGGVFFSNVGAERITPEIIEILQMSLVIAFAVVGGMESLLGAAAGAFIARYLLEWMREISIPNLFDVFDVSRSSSLGIDLVITNDQIIISPGAWRYALFGVVMILTLRYARNGLLYPVLQWFGGRDAALKQTVSKREGIPAPEDDPETEATP